MMERSKAIVCPTAAYQLAGTKKVQQVLAAPGVVERFIKDSAAVQRIRSTFADQFSLDLVFFSLRQLFIFCHYKIQ